MSVVYSTIFFPWVNILLRTNLDVCNLEHKLFKSRHVTENLFLMSDYGKDLPTYLKYCKDVIFAGAKMSYDEELLFRHFWQHYEKLGEEVRKISSTVTLSISFFGLNNLVVHLFFLLKGKSIWGTIKYSKLHYTYIRVYGKIQEPRQL